MRFSSGTSVSRSAITLTMLAGALVVGWNPGAVFAQGVSPHGDVYYLDGAGGGGLLTNWGRGVKKGLDEAGYNGKFVEPKWETGMGVLADQAASVEYKRQKAGEVAAQIREAKSKYPEAPIALMGLSAGTAVAVFTLEALPPDCQVDTVILLGASISSDYDLTRALSRVSGRLYVFTSEHDAVLSFAVPMAGTADRQSGDDPSAGLDGFVLPAGASQTTRRLYSKVTNIAWRSDFEKDGDWGGHTDTTQPRFVRDHIAPLVMQEGPHNVHPNWRSTR